MWKKLIRRNRKQIVKKEKKMVLEKTLKMKGVSLKEKLKKRTSFEKRLWRKELRKQSLKEGKVNFSFWMVKIHG